MKKLNADESRREHENDKYKDKLCIHLLGGLERDYVYDMGKVWTCYEKMCEEGGVQPAPKYISRRSIFYDEFERRIGSNASFVRPLDRKQFLVMCPSEKSEHMIAKGIKSAEERTDGDSSRSSFNEATCTIDTPVTTPGMLPIRQAPADDNDTMTTVINRFVSLTEDLGKKHAVIAADQPTCVPANCQAARALSMDWHAPTCASYRRAAIRRKIRS